MGLSAEDEEAEQERVYNLYKICPRCGAAYYGWPKTSKRDGSYICQYCRVREVHELDGRSPEEVEGILEVLHKHHDSAMIPWALSKEEKE